MVAPRLNRRQRVRWLSLRIWLRRLAFWGGAVGIGLAATLFTDGANAAMKLFQRGVDQLFWLPLVVTPLTLAGVAAVTRRYFRGAEGSGIPQAIATLKMAEGAERGRVLSLKLAFGKMMLTCVGLLGGASVGREGPTVQVGAAILHALYRNLRYPGRLPERALIVAGGAAGVAAAFNTPLAGIVFAIEEMSRSFEEKTSGTLLTAVIIAGLAAVYVQGNYTYFGTTHAEVSGAQGWLAVLLMGLWGGLAGGLFSRLLLAYSRRGLPGQLGRYLRAHPVLFAGLCGLVLALLGLISAHSVFGTGYDESRALLENSREVPAYYGLLKLLATLVSFISGIPGGIFSPSLAVGAGLGANLAGFLPDAAPGAVIVLGMAAYFAGVVQAPITAFVIVMEMTDNQDMLVPLMLTSLLATAVSRSICRQPIYKALAEQFLARRQQRPAAPAVTAPSAPDAPSSGH